MCLFPAWINSAGGSEELTASSRRGFDSHLLGRESVGVGQVVVFEVAPDEQADAPIWRD